MKIKQAAEKSGLTARNIRFYEEIGLIGVDRKNNGYREYDENDIIHLKQIKVLRELGLTTEDIRNYFNKNISLHDLMQKRKIELLKQKNDVQALYDLCQKIEKQNLPLTASVTNHIESVLTNKEKMHNKEYGVLLTSEWSYGKGKKAFINYLLPPFIYCAIYCTLLILAIVNALNYFNQQTISSQYTTFLIISTILIGTFIYGILFVKDGHYELYEDGIYFINSDTPIKSLKYFYHIFKGDYLQYMEFIHYEDIQAVKAGVQKSGMITGGDYIFTFYLVIFTKDDRVVRLDSNMFYDEQHFLTTLQILYDKSPKWIDPKHISKLFEMPKEKAYKILNTYYWEKRPWHSTPFYKKIMRK